MNIFDIVRGTPTWVWILFVFLLWRATQALKPRTIALPSLFIMPLLFFVLAAQGLFKHGGAYAALWIGGLGAGMLCGWLLIRNLNVQIVDRAKLLIRLPGTWMNIFLVLGIFGVKYFFGCTAAICPALLTIPTFFVLKPVLYGLIGDISLGRAAGLVRKFFA